MGFPASFSMLLRNLYRGARAKIKLAGALSNAVSQSRGTQQGCPLSPLLFAIYLDPLAQAVRQSPLQGYKWDEMQLKITLYADDIIISLHALTTQDSHPHDISDKVGIFSGCKINKDKTQAFIIGLPPRERPSPAWVDNMIKYLGVTLLPTFQRSLVVSSEIVMTRIRENFQRWNDLNMDEEQKIQALHWHMLSHVLYLERAFAVPMVVEHHRSLQVQARRFLWGRLRPRVACAILMLPRERVGLAIPNLLHYSWAGSLTIWAQLLNPDFGAIWKNMVLSRLGGDIEYCKLSCFGPQVLRPGVGLSPGY